MCCVNVSAKDSTCSRASWPNNPLAAGMQKTRKNSKSGFLGFMAMRTCMGQVCCVVSVVCFALCHILSCRSQEQGSAHHGMSCSDDHCGTLLHRTYTGQSIGCTWPVSIPNRSRFPVCISDNVGIAFKMELTLCGLISPSIPLISSVPEMRRSSPIGVMATRASCRMEGMVGFKL